ncbi:MBL fold metallo-hydrolase [candidate division TA06 bacterium]|nr:MBL fold metallo-hydrolase [candidate division TA06 bacterium]
MAKEMEAEELKSSLERGDSLFMLDVRTPEEYADWRIEGVLNVPINDLDTQLAQLPKNREIVTICARGNRSQLAADFLTKAGYQVKSLRGGMVAWNTVYNTVHVPLQLDGKGQVFQMRRLGKGCISYLIVSEGEALVVDPSCRTEKFLEVAKENDAKITHVADTHQHADHVSGARLLAETTGASLYLNPLEEYLFSDFKPIEDGASVTVGNVSIRFIHAPGHTRGSTVFQIGDQALLTGDILFVEGVGRPDLRDKAQDFAEELYSTYQKRLNSQSDDLVVFPAHYGSQVKVQLNQPISATLGELKKRIGLFNVTKDEFISYVTSNIPPRPPNTQYIVKINRGEIDCDPLQAERLEEGPNRCAVSVTR